MRAAGFRAPRPYADSNYDACFNAVWRWLQHLVERWRAHFSLLNPKVTLILYKRLTEGAFWSDKSTCFFLFPSPSISSSSIDWRWAHFLYADSRKLNKIFMWKFSVGLILKIFPFLFFSRILVSKVTESKIKELNRRHFRL